MYAVLGMPRHARLARAGLLMVMLAAAACGGESSPDDPTDAGAGDAGTDASICDVVSPETCNGVDDDCNGTIDDPAVTDATCVAGRCDEAACVHFADPTTTWLRSTETGTEVLIFGVASSDGSPSTPTSRSYLCVRGTVAHGGSARIDVGNYTVNGTGHGSFVYGSSFAVAYPNQSWLARSGATQTRHSPAVVESLSFAAGSNGALLVTLGSAEHAYTSLGALTATIDETTAAGATELYRLLAIDLALHRSRVLGYGGGGITAYTNAPRGVEGLTSGEVFVANASVTQPSLSLEHRPIGASSVPFVELSGITLAGTETRTFNLQGNGTRTGALAFTLARSGEATLTGTLTLGTFLANTDEASASNSIAIDGVGSTDVSWTVGTNLDLRAVLPVVSP